MSYLSEQDKLQGLLKAGKLEPFISHIRFPNFKNLAQNTKIEFSHPVSALVGANGTNKSSVLRALYGAPGYNNLGNLWFSTSIDPIEESPEGPSCFIYGYKNPEAGKIVEVIKTRIRKEDDPDYWEPSRPILSYGMERPPKIPEGEPTPKGRSKTRWNTIEKNVVYLDFRAALSAYDKFFYHGELRGKPNTEKNRKDFVRTRSPHLKKALEEKRSSYFYRKKERISAGENRQLNTDETEAISTILGKEYTAIQIVRHSFFNCDAYTCLMQTAGLRYTEAFAGSGEFAIARTVIGVMNAPERSLILLDEPEVSLHPGAQDRLMTFLCEQVKAHKHQIVISTHSPVIVRRLPPRAIKVFVMDSSSGRVVLPRQDSLPEEAFFHLGDPAIGKIIVIVEDALAVAIVKRALCLAGEAAVSLFDVRCFPGGSQTLWGHYLPIFAAEERSDVLVLFDADRRPATALLDPTNIPEAEEAKVRAEILRVAGVDIAFHVDGGTKGKNVQQEDEMRRGFLAWARKYVDYLPGKGIPETFVWQRMASDDMSMKIKGKDTKAKFEQLARAELGLASFEPISSSDILQTQRRRLASIPDADPDLVGLRCKLLDFARTLGLE